MNATKRLLRAVLFLVSLVALFVGLAMIVSGSLLGILALLLGLAVFVWIGKDSVRIQDSPSEVYNLPNSQVIAPEENNDQENSTANKTPPDLQILAQDLEAKQVANSESGTETEMGVPQIVVTNSRVRKPIPIWIAIVGILCGIGLGYVVGRANANNRSSGDLNGPSSVTKEKLPESELKSQGSAVVQSGLSSSTLKIANQTVDVQYSELDMGQIENIFDEKPDTLMRGKAANPYILQLNYAQPFSASIVSFRLAVMTNAKVTFIAKKEDGTEITENKEWNEDQQRPQEPVLKFNLAGAPVKIKSIRFEVLDRRLPPNEGFHTHIIDLSVK